jgi:hypothetical protein
VIGILLRQEEVSHFIQGRLTKDMSMASARIALRESEVMQMKLHLSVLVDRMQGYQYRL